MRRIIERIRLPVWEMSPKIHSSNLPIGCKVIDAVIMNEQVCVYVEGPYNGDVEEDRELQYPCELRLLAVNEMQPFEGDMPHFKTIVNNDQNRVVHVYADIRFKLKGR
jgi:hypothetical protein